MTITRLTSREFNQDAGRAKRAASEGPVFITDRGRTALVLLTFEDYRRLAGQGRNIVDILAMPDDQDVEFEPPRIDIGARAADF